MMYKLFFAMIFLLSLAGLSYSASPELLFEAGNRAYLDGDWVGALAKWEEVEESGYQNGELFYNMGNAAFKLNELGKAILYWEKAARLSGEDDDIQTNLKIARARLTDKLDEEVRLPVWDWFDQFRARFSTNFIGWSAIVLCFLLFTTLSVRRWVFHNRTGILKTVSIALAVLLTINVGLLYLKAHDAASNRYGILLVKESEVLSAPAVGTGKLLFTLHEGTKVRVLRQLDKWMEISAGKDKQGWVKHDAISVI